MESTKEENEIILAGRGSRIGAIIIDSIVIMVISIPVAYIFGWFDGLSETPPEKPSFFFTFSMFIFNTILYALINWKFLSKNGQSIGKKVMEIKITNLDGSVPNPNDIIIKRYIPYVGVSLIPIFSPLIGLINVLFVFKKDRRCLHDYLANTKVVKCKL